MTNRVSSGYILTTLLMCICTVCPTSFWLCLNYTYSDFSLGPLFTRHFCEIQINGEKWKIFIYFNYFSELQSDFAIYALQDFWNLVKLSLAYTLADTTNEPLLYFSLFCIQDSEFI